MIDTTISSLDLMLIFAYVLMMLGVGYWVHRRSPTFEQYLVAGRGMTTPILICTLASTYYGLDVLFGTSELAFNEGVVAFFGYSKLSLGVYILAAFALSRRLHKASFTSLPEILERHYGRTSGAFGAVASFSYSIPALGLFAPGVPDREPHRRTAHRAIGRRMNGWDLLTYLSSVALGLGAVVIFGYFLRDARELLDPSELEKDEE